MSCKIKAIRRELYLANDVMGRSMDIKRQIRLEQEMKREQSGLSQSKKKLQPMERGKIR
jgi:hypothetical protein